MSCGIADDRRLGDLGVQHQGAFDLGGAHPVARDVDDIVDPAGDPVIAVVVALAAVAGEVLALVGAEIGLHEAVVIAVDGARLAGPAVRDAQIALGRAVQNVAIAIDQLRADAEERHAGAARLHVMRAGQGGDHAAAGFGLPPGVDHRAAALADDVEIPAPGLGIDRLADRAEQAQRCTHGSSPVIALAHQRADRGGGGVEDVDLVLVHHVPEAAVIGVVGHAFEHHGGRAVEQRAVDHIAVPGDPADIGGAPEHLARLVIEDVVEGRRRPHAIAAGGVEHALGLAGRTRGVEDEQRVFRAHHLARAILVAGDVLKPMVAALVHRDCAAGVADHQHAIDRRGVRGERQRRIDIRLERHVLAAAQAFIGGDDEAAAAILDPARQRFGREATEHHRMHRTQPCAGEHGGHAFEDHRQIERHPVAALHAQLFQRIGHPNHFCVEFAIGEAAARAGRIIWLEDQRRAVGVLRQMPVDRIVAQVELAISKP